MISLLPPVLATALAAPAPPELCPATEQDAEKVVAGLSIKAPVLPLGDTPTPYIYDGGGAPVWDAVPEGYGTVKSKQALFALIRIIPGVRASTMPAHCRRACPAMSRRNVAS